MEGVRIFNSLPEDLKTWSGKPEEFKEKLDKFLECIPDQPQTESLIPGGKDLYGAPSNSIPDWILTLKINGNPAGPVIT